MPLDPELRSPVDSQEESARAGIRLPDNKDGLRPTLTIGLVNNMQDGALEATERQFTSLLQSASQDVALQLRFYQLPGIPRGEAAARHVEKYYSDFDSIWNTPPDALIVTGREPLAARLQDEQYWQSFVRLLEWAQDHTISTVWSCLAAHAAVLHMDGIGRVRSKEKYCGLFDCETVSGHPVIAGTPSRFAMPHSRWNGLEERELVKHGYEILTRSANAGVDTFVRQNRSLFVFFQGHPEYEANTLLLEYRRDVARYLRGETTVYPSLPETYFDAHTIAALRAVQNQALLCANEELLGQLSSVLRESTIHHSWQPAACSIYRNWLHYLAAQKQSACHALAISSAQSTIPGPTHIIGGTGVDNALSGVTPQPAI